MLSGGGSLGAVQVGMLQALARHGFQPDLLVGASVGALNAAYVAGTGLGDEALLDLGEIWRGLHRRDVFPFAPHRHLLALAGLRPALCSPRALATLVEEHLCYVELSQAKIPVHIVATDVLSGIEVILSTGDARTAVLASAAIPAVLPPVEVDGRPLFDGGIADHAPVTQAVRLGADRVVVLPAGVACSLPGAPRSAVGTAIHALSLLLHQRLLHDVEALSDQVEIVVLPPLCPVTTSAADFRWAGSLIDRAFETSNAWLSQGRYAAGDPARVLALHRHPA